MKKYFTILILIIAVLQYCETFAQDKDLSKSKQKTEDLSVDTRIDNMGYWMKKAEQGLVPYNPPIPFKPVVYKGSQLTGKGIKATDSPDVPVTSATDVTQSENSIFIDPNDNQYVLNSNNSTGWNGSSYTTLYGANYYQSADGGFSFGGSYQGAGGTNSGDPTTAINSSGTQFVNFISSSSGQGIAYSTDGGVNWTTATVGPNPGSLADKNHMWIDNSPTSSNNGNLYVAWTDFGGTYDSEIVLSRSTNNGVSWSTRINLSAASNAGSHNQGVNVQTGPNGEVYVVWAIYDSWPSDETRLAMAKSTNGGSSFSSSYDIITNINGIRSTEVPQNMRVNSFPVMAVDISGGTNNGNVYVIWTNVGTPGVNSGTAGVYMIRSTNGGTVWSTPIKVNQGTGTAYQPWITCDSETGTLAVVYYDNRNTTTTADAEAWVSYSFDAGTTWTDMRVSDVEFTPTPISGLASGYMGDYLAITSKGGRVYPCWTDNRGSTYMTYVSPFDLGLTASFTGTPTSVCTGSTVTFTDQSSGSPTSWNWTFTGGSPASATGQGPHTITYNTVNSYQVSLTVGDGATTDTETVPNYITVQNIIADYTANPTTIVVGNTVTFTDNSSCNPTSWNWSFPGGTPSSASGSGPHTITYNTTGLFTSSLTVANGANNDTKTIDIDVINCNYCTASGGGDEYISGVQFGTINNTGTPSSNYYDYTSLSTSVFLSQTYPITVTNGNVYTVDDLGVWIDWNQDCDFDDTGENVVCEVSNSGQGTYNITVPGTAALGSTRMRVRIKWSGDDCGSPCGSTTYGEVEDYTVVIQSSSSPPVADFTADDTTPVVGQTVNFTDMTANSPTSWSWSFSPTTITYVGGTNSGSQDPQVQFNASGYYTVTLTATNAQGSDPETKTNYILAGTAGNWTGNTNTNWNLNTNWETLVIPTSSDNVTIPAMATNWPTFSGNFSFGTECNNMTLEGASEFTVTGDLTIPTGNILAVNASSIINVGGDWNNNGTFNSGTGTVIFDGNTNAIIDAAGTISGSLQTTFAGGNGSNGNMFDIVALNEITITSFDGNLDVGTGNAHVYYKTGTYVGNETNSGAWTLVGTASVTSSGAGSPTAIPIPVNITIPSGQTYAFYVHAENGNDYTNGSGVGNVYASDANIQILEGCGKGNPLFTGGTYQPRVFNGIANYSYGSGSGSVTYNNLVIGKTNAEVSNNVDVTINGNLTVNPGAWFTNNTSNTIDVNGNTYFEADASGMASFIDNGTTTIGGNTFVEQYLTSQRWHLVSPPLSGATINTYYNIYLKEYNEPTDDWTYLVTPTTIPMNQGQGYSAWASDSYTGTTTVTYTGNLNNSDIVFSNLDYTPAAAKAGFNLLGNPYPCALNWSNSWSMSNMSGWMVIYDNGTYRGMHTDGTPYNGKTDGIIPSTQGFWVRAMNASASITIPASQRVHDDQAFYKETNEIIYPYVRLESEINGYKDEAVVIFHPEATSGYDGYYDLTKFDNVSEAPQLYTMTEGGNYGVNFYHETYENEVIPVGFRTEEAGMYTIASETVANFDGNVNVYLEDLKTGGFKKLYEGTEHSFSYDPMDEEHRFNLYFTYDQVGSLETTIAGMDIYSFGQTVYIKNPDLLSGEVTIYNVMGNVVVISSLEETPLKTIPVKLDVGYYFVKIQSGNNLISEKVFIK